MDITIEALTRSMERGAYRSEQLRQIINDVNTAYIKYRNTVYRKCMSNNWLKQHGFPMRRKS